MWLYRYFIIALSLGSLAACGFEPLYSRNAAVNASAEMASIRILPIEDRIGQLLRNHLLDLLNSQGRPRKPRYTLKVETSEASGNVAVSKESFATRVNYTLRASFTLYVSGSENKSGVQKIAFSGSDQVVTSYNVLESNYATQVAENSARSDAVRQVALNIQNQIAARFKTRPIQPAAADKQAKN